MVAFVYQNRADIAVEVDRGLSQQREQKGANPEHIGLPDPSKRSGSAGGGKATGNYTP